jgi:Integrase zinc binding domain
MELVDHGIPILKARATTLLDGSELSAKYLDDKIMHDQETQQATIQRWWLSHSLTKNRLLWTKNGALVVVGNNDVKRGVISLFHDTSTAGHPGITKTLLMMAKYYWWLGMKEFVTNYVKGCATCQMTEVNTHPSRPTLFPITAEPNALPFQTIAVDFIVKLPISDGYDSILTITDHDCSKAAIFLPCNESINAPRVAELYARQVFPDYGIPRKIISDRDPRFATNFTTELCKMLRIKQNISSAYHPQMDGQSECTNQSLEQYLRAFCRNNQGKWARWLSIAQYTKNSWPHATTKKTPYDMILGYTPTTHQPIRETDIPTLDKRIDHVRSARKQAQEAMSKAQEGLIKATKFKGYEEGEKVWLEGTNIKRPYDSPKLSPR